MIVVVNSSTLVSDADVALMTRACAAQLKHVAEHWNFKQMPVVFQQNTNSYADPRVQLNSVVSLVKQNQPGAWIINIMDNADQAGVLGWHTEEQGNVIYGRVFAKPVLDNGGTTLGGSLSVSSVLSHEVVETYVDPHVQLWAESGDNYLMAFEACDPVESDSYTIKINKKPVSVSNFVFPEYFDSMNASGPFDWLAKINHAFEIGVGGYAVIMKEGKVSQKFGHRYPDWRKDMKKTSTSRTARRSPDAAK